MKAFFILGAVLMAGATAAVAAPLPDAVGAMLDAAGGDAVQLKTIADIAKKTNPQSVAEIHVYHPQPFYDAKLIHKRLITPEFISLVHRSLIPGGLFVIQTDNPGYWKYIQQIVPLFFEFEERPSKWPDAPKGRTRREIIALRENLPVFRGTGKPRSDITPDDAVKLASSLPAPQFDADRKLMALDKLERESGGDQNKARPRSKKH